MNKKLIISLALLSTKVSVEAVHETTADADRDQTGVSLSSHNGPDRGLTEEERAAQQRAQDLQKGSSQRLTSTSGSAQPTSGKVLPRGKTMPVAPAVGSRDTGEAQRLAAEGQGVQDLVLNDILREVQVEPQLPKLSFWKSFIDTYLKSNYQHRLDVLDEISKKGKFFSKTHPSLSPQNIARLRNTLENGSDYQKKRAKRDIDLFYTEYNVGPTGRMIKNINAKYRMALDNLRIFSESRLNEDDSIEFYYYKNYTYLRVTGRDHSQKTDIPEQQAVCLREIFGDTFTFSRKDLQDFLSNKKTIKEIKDEQAAQKAQEEQRIAEQKRLKAEALQKAEELRKQEEQKLKQQKAAVVKALVNTIEECRKNLKTIVPDELSKEYSELNVQAKELFEKKEFWFTYKRLIDAKRNLESIVDIINTEARRLLTPDELIRHRGEFPIMQEILRLAGLADLSSPVSRVESNIKGLVLFAPYREDFSENIFELVKNVKIYDLLPVGLVKNIDGKYTYEEPFKSMQAVVNADSEGKLQFVFTDGKVTMLDHKDTICKVFESPEEVALLQNLFNRRANRGQNVSAQISADLLRQFLGGANATWERIY